jgi:membrane protein YdbS with pleckstrin-like domain
MTMPNSSLAPESLPRLEQAPLTPVSPRLSPCQAVQQSFGWLLMTLVVGFVPLGDSPLAIWQPWLAGALAGLGVVRVMLGWIEARQRAYGLREHDLIYRRGLLVRRTQVLPLVRLQHVETLSNPVERSFGLVRLSCFTAGGRGADLILEGLPGERAEAIKQHLLARLSSPGLPEKDHST